MGYIFILEHILNICTLHKHKRSEGIKYIISLWAPIKNKVNTTTRSFLSPFVDYSISEI